MIDLQELKDELVNDPAGLGYDLTRRDRMLRLINERNISDTPVDNLQRRDVLAALDWSDVPRLSAVDREVLRLLLLEEFITFSSSMRTTLAGLFPPNSNSRAALAALLLREGSRAEQLWGTGTLVNPQDINAALELP